MLHRASISLEFMIEAIDIALIVGKENESYNTVVFVKRKYSD